MVKIGKRELLAILLPLIDRAELRRLSVNLMNFDIPLPEGAR
jgi:hypothetical protein